MGFLLTNCSASFTNSFVLLGFGWKLVHTNYMAHFHLEETLSHLNNIICPHANSRQLKYYGTSPDSLLHNNNEWDELVFVSYVI